MQQRHERDAGFVGPVTESPGHAEYNESHVTESPDHAEYDESDVPESPVHADSHAVCLPGDAG